MTTRTDTPTRLAKGFTHGTHRRCSPAETWERIQPSFHKVGLTRNADITGLDRLGIPVTIALRPNSPTMANSTGKGLTVEAAMVSGAMEAMELFHAEHVMHPRTVASYERMAERGAVISRDDLALTRGAVFSPSVPEEWVVGRDLLHGDEVALPYPLVALWDDSFRAPSFLASFQVGSNGLASGNDYAEAMVSALLEVIERDAVTCHKLADHHLGQSPPRVRLETIASPTIQGLLEQLRWAGVTTVLFDCRVDTAVPVYLCYLHEPNSGSVSLCMGYGAHLDPEIAMSRAITEAAQGRLVVISGSRDDIFRRNLQQIQRVDLSTRLAQMLAVPETVDASALVSEATDTFEGDVELMLAKLRAAGLDRAVAFDLSRDDFPFAVVRVVVPGLEGYVFDYYTPGRRARAFLEARTGERAAA